MKLFVPVFATVVVAFAGTLAGCTALLGDFQVAADAGDASLVMDASADSATERDVLVPPDGEAGSDAACVPETDSTPNRCGCVVETDAMFCLRLGKNCGPVSGIDNCGTARAVASCGPACASPQTCGAHVPSVCGDPVCSPETDTRFCARYGKNCNSFSNIDNCGTNRTVSCGATCPAFQSCGAITPNVCGCIPESDSSFCARLNLTCGTQSGTDNCGVARTGVSCGSCGGGNTCTNGACGCNGAVACSGGLTCCSGGCVDTNNNTTGTDCGGCGTTCAPGNYWSCKNQRCTCTMAVSGGMCGAACVSLSRSPNCGACGVTCASGQQCCLTNLSGPYACAPAGSGIICYP